MMSTFYCVWTTYALYFHKTFEILVPLQKRSIRLRHREYATNIKYKKQKALHYIRKKNTQIHKVEYIKSILRRVHKEAQSNLSPRNTCVLMYRERTNW